MKQWIPLYIIGGLAGASGINGVIALWMPVEHTDDSLLNNFRFFLIMTMILNIFVSKNPSRHSAAILRPDLGPCNVPAMESSK